MTNEELVRRIRQSIRKEESSAQVYYRHLRSVVLRSNLPRHLQTDLRDTLDRLGQEDQAHRAALEKMLAELEDKKHDQ